MNIKKHLKRINEMSIGDIIETKKYYIECFDYKGMGCNDCSFLKYNCSDIDCGNKRYFVTKKVSK